MKDASNFELNDSELRMWVEQGSSIHIIAVTKHGDPVELTGSQARKLANSLLRMAEEVDAD